MRLSSSPDGLAGTVFVLFKLAVWDGEMMCVDMVFSFEFEYWHVEILLPFVFKATEAVSVLLLALNSLLVDALRYLARLIYAFPL